MVTAEIAAKLISHYSKLISGPYGNLATEICLLFLKCSENINSVCIKAAGSADGKESPTALNSIRFYSSSTIAIIYSDVSVS